jgi:hypothetical protein
MGLLCLSFRSTPGAVLEGSRAVVVADFLYAGFALCVETGVC